MTQIHPSYDKNLWVMVPSCCSGKHYLLSNPHTFPGRMTVWCPLHQGTLYVSKSDFESGSVEAQYWVKGFLIGNEPSPPTTDEGDDLPDDDLRMIRWWAAIRQFPETGIWIRQERHCQSCGELLLPTQPGLKCSRCIQRTT
jgi:hypothetical protein